jgi:hypothetical protein
MLNGIDPILIFLFYKNSKEITPANDSHGSGFIAEFSAKLSLPPIPIYLSEKLTGLYVDTQEKNVDIQTTSDSLLGGDEVRVTQKALNSVVKISMVANKESLGLTVLSALIDLIPEKVSSQEYSITYMHGPTIIFGGRLHSFAIHQEAGNTLSKIDLELVSVPKKKGKVSVDNVSEGVQANGTAALPKETVAGGVKKAASSGAAPRASSSSSFPVGALP